MNDWSVDIESGGGVAARTEDLERLAQALDDRAQTAGAAASLNTSTGVIAVTFGVQASDAVEAAELGVAAFRAALAAGGLARLDPARVTVERIAVDSTVLA